MVVCVVGIVVGCSRYREYIYDEEQISSFNVKGKVSQQ